MSTLQDLARRYAEERETLNDMQAAAKAQQARVDEAQEALFTALENQGVESTRVPELGLFSMNDLAWARIVDRPRALAWAEERMPEVLTLNHQQLSKVVRDALKGEGEMPEGVDFTTSRKITWRKA